MDEHQFKYGKSAPIPKSHGCGPDLPANPICGDTASGTVAHSILTEAAEVVRGNRNTVHGDKERSFTVIAQLWSAYLDGRARLARGAPIRAIDVAQMMVLMKIARSVQGQAIRDHYVDAAGYAAIAGEIAAAES